MAIVHRSSYSWPGHGLFLFVSAPLRSRTETRDHASPNSSLHADEGSAGPISRNTGPTVRHLIENGRPAGRVSRRCASSRFRASDVPPFQKHEGCRQTVSVISRNYPSPDEERGGEMESLGRHHLVRKGPCASCLVPRAWGHGWGDRQSWTLRCVWVNPPRCPERPLSRPWATAVTGGASLCLGLSASLRGDPRSNQQGFPGRP